MVLKIVLIGFLLLIPMVPTFWAIVDVPGRRFSSTAAKVVWFLVVATLPCIGAVLYFLLARRHTERA